MKTLLGFIGGTIASAAPALAAMHHPDGQRSTTDMRESLSRDELTTLFARELGYPEL